MGCLTLAAKENPVVDYLCTIIGAISSMIGGLFVSSAIVGQTTSTVITPDTGVSIGMLVVILSGVASVAMWLGVTLTSTKRDIKDLKNDMKELRSEMQRKPCFRNNNPRSCEEEGK